MSHNATIFQKLLMLPLFMIPLLSYAKTIPSVLDYHSPSATWMGAIPIGNGRIGAMIYGGTAKETIALNEVTMWSGQHDTEANNLCGPEHLKEIRQAFFSGNTALGNELTTRYLSGHGRSFGTNLPFGDLNIKFHNRSGQPSDYHRRLFMNCGTTEVSYSINGKRYLNQYFCSNPADVMIAHYTSSARHDISANIGVSMLRHSQVMAKPDGLWITGDARFDKCGTGGVKFLAIIRVLANGGEKTVGKDCISVKRANELTVIVDIRTDYMQDQYADICNKTIDKAVRTSYDKLKRQHQDDFSRLFSRMSIDLGGDGNTDVNQLFAEAHAGQSNPAFDALFFQFGRYMLISSSRENSPLPAHLQGIWNDNLACNMPWTCDYHLDINIEQNYWAANIANLAECNQPLFKYIELLARYGHDTARKVYGCDGWVAHTINNVWGYTAPGNGIGWALNVTAGAWLATHLWTHYDFTRNRQWLCSTGYPLLKATATFFTDYMVTDPRTGYLVTGPSISPECAYRTADGSVWSVSMMPTIDRAIVHDIYQACINSAKILDTDSIFRSRLEHDIRLLPPLELNDDGELKEWFDDVKRADPAHRHASHLVTLYPLGQISPEHTPALAEGCRQFLNHQLGNPQWEDTEWSRANAICFYARLKDNEKAYSSILGLYGKFMRENLMTVSPKGVAGAEDDIFSFDATEAAVAGMCEMLLQSYDGCLDFLPALPTEWKDGSIRGICARGGIEADISWKDGKVTYATLRSNNNQTVRCKINGRSINVKLKSGHPLKLKAKLIRSL